MKIYRIDLPSDIFVKELTIKDVERKNQELKKSNNKDKPDTSVNGKPHVVPVNSCLIKKPKFDFKIKFNPMVTIAALGLGIQIISLVMRRGDKDEKG